MPLNTARQLGPWLTLADGTNADGERSCSEKECNKEAQSKDTLILYFSDRYESRYMMEWKYL